MRKIRIIEHISLDGVIQAPGGQDDGGEDNAHGGWAAPYRSAAGGEAVVVSSHVLVNTYRHVGALQ
jgi:hypothetical protein